MTVIQNRRGSSSEWTTANPILADGEIGYETDTGKHKIGNGVSSWLGLSYFVNESDIVTVNSATTTELISIVNSVNTQHKYVGRPIFNTTTGKPVWATGSSAGSVWNDATGSVAHTPV